MCCISFYSYIKPQPDRGWAAHSWVVYRSIPTSNRNYYLFGFRQATLYIVLFLHQTATRAAGNESEVCCISFYSYIKPQLRGERAFRRCCCISFYSYIKPQRSNIPKVLRYVVYRSIPTSNRNPSRLHPTRLTLYIVLFLHQTATEGWYFRRHYSCISFYSYIKPQLQTSTTTQPPCCISFYSYIKPQQAAYVVSLRIGCISFYSYIKPQPVKHTWPH